MFKYMIRRKAPGEMYDPLDLDDSLLRSEDLLTSDFFGTMLCYLPAVLLLKPFLEDVARKNPHAQAFASLVGSLPSDPIDVEFWPHFPLSMKVPGWTQEDIEPDMLIRLPDGGYLLIEAKFRSAVDPEQLAREFIVGQAKFGLERFFLLLITADLVPPRIGPVREKVQDYIAGRVASITGLRADEIAERVVWTNWQAGAGLAQSLPDRINALDLPATAQAPFLRIAEDLLEVLKLRELGPFQRLEYQRLINMHVSREALSMLAGRLSGFSSALDVDGLAAISPATEPVRRLLRGMA